MQIEEKSNFKVGAKNSKKPAAIPKRNPSYYLPKIGNNILPSKNDLALVNKLYCSPAGWLFLLYRSGKLFKSILFFSKHAKTFRHIVVLLARIVSQSIQIRVEKVATHVQLDSDKKLISKIINNYNENTIIF